MQLVFNTILLIKILSIESNLMLFLKNKAFKIAADPKVNGYQRSLAAMVYKF